MKTIKFRRLSKDELIELESEFVTFLASNSVTATDWEKLKHGEPSRAENLIEVFSDIVFEKVVKGVGYLEFKTKDDIKTFHCQDEKIIMNGLRVSGKTDLDLSANYDPEEMMDKLQKSGASLQLYTAEKAYKPNREQEIFRMMEGGALISKDGFLFNAFEGLKAKNDL